jgi:hypothetical protein
MAKITIDSVCCVRIWLDDSGQGEPSVLQPNWPDGTQWGSVTEAQSWAEAVVEMWQNPDSLYVPGKTPSQPLLERPVEEEPNAETV